MKTFGRRTLAAVMSLIMVLSCFAGLTFSVGAESSGDYEYYFNSDEEIVLTRYNGSDSVVKIPTEIDGYTVVCLFMDFKNSDKITKVIIPDTITYIMENPFVKCSALNEIVVDENNEYFKSVDGVLFNKEMTKLRVYPANRSGDYTIPDSVNSIADYAFSDCTGLTHIYIPENIEHLDNELFWGCSNLNGITVSPNHEKYKSIDGILFNKDMTEIIAYPATRKGGYVIPDSVTLIRNYAFLDCKELTSITLPDKISSICIGAFMCCDKLTSVVIPGSVNAVTSYAFYSCTNLTSVFISEGVKRIESGAFRGCKNLKNIAIPQSVDIFGEDIFFTEDEKSEFGELTVYGYLGSEAEKYAADNGFKFVDINSCEHSYTDIKNNRDATCTEAGYSGDKYCAVCNKLIETGVEIPALGHKEETIKGKSATCTEKGLTDGIKCSVCGEVIKAQEEIPALGHREVTIKGKSATCTEKGLTDGVKCSVCGEVIKAQEEIAATGHKFDKGVCTVCGAIDPDYKVVLESVSKNIKVDNKSKAAVFTPASSSGMKIAEFKKQFDGEISVDIDDNSLVANGTKFKFGDNEFTVIVKGDVQADGKITASDARSILRISAKLDKADDAGMSAADVNGDGKVTAGEARRVLRFSAKLEKSISN